MPPRSSHCLPATRRRGVALVIVLGLIVLVSGVVLAFFSRAISDSQVSGSSAASARTELLLQGAIDSTVGDLKQEIVAGSTKVLPAATPPYTPNDALTVPPSIQANSPVNVVARSASGTPLYVNSGAATYLPAATVRAAAAPTTAASLNGRSISAARWNKPLFLPATSDLDLTPPGGFAAPDWVLVARDGSNPTTAVSDQDSNQFVTGRYGYVIYNEGALLDLNAAGYPNDGTGAPVNAGMSVDQLSRKGSLALSDLTQVGLTAAQVNTILAWRNNATFQANGAPKGGMTSNPTTGSGATFYDFVTSKGFLQNDPSGQLGVVPTAVNNKQTDQGFRGRQDLIKFLVQGMAVTGSSARGILQKTSMFSREYNSVALSAYGANVTVQGSFTRADGTTAQGGEPLLKHRFPLNRINLLSDATNNTAAIKQYFGLVAGPGGTWNYNPGSGAVTAGLPSIASLSQVAAQGREPNFFELLNAAIDAGSLGASHGKNAFYNTAQDANKTRQIFQIGLNILDQYDADDDPTVLTLGSTAPYVSADIVNTMPISGVENLPYPLMVGLQTFKDPNQTAGTGQSYFEAYQQWVLWNPHKSPLAHAAGSQQKFRVRVNGEAYAAYVENGANKDTSANPHTFLDECVYFSTRNNPYSPMAVLGPADVDSSLSAPVDRFPRTGGSPTQAIGFYIAEYRAQSNSGNLRHAYNQPLTYSFEKLDSQNRWLPYCTLPRMARPYGDDASGITRVGTSMTGGPFYSSITCSHADPRTARFGLSQGGGTESNNLASNAYVPDDLISSTGGSIKQGAIVDNDTPPAATVVAPFPNNAMTGADLAYNTISGGLYYKDPDGTARKADGNLALGRITGGMYKLDASNHTTGEANPVVLNRAFTSVAEMGYAFRDAPWRSLNFYSSDSADAALLDYFTVNETGDLRAGVVDINNAPVPVLAAVIAGAYHKPGDTSTANYATPATATSIATKIYAYLHPATGSRKVLRGNGDLATMIDSLALANPADLGVDLKFDREMLVRALAPVANLRTWNLLIDVIAQTGRYPANTVASDLNKFRVEGERRAWVHVAIDRFTGKVVSRQIEYVNE